MRNGQCKIKTRFYFFYIQSIKKFIVFCRLVRKSLFHKTKLVLFDNIKCYNYYFEPLVWTQILSQYRKILFYCKVKFENNLQLSLRQISQVYLDFFQQVVRMCNLGITFFANLQKNLLSPLGAYSVREFRSPGQRIWVETIRHFLLLFFDRVEKVWEVGNNNNLCFNALWLLNIHTRLTFYEYLFNLVSISLSVLTIYYHVKILISFPYTKNCFR